MDLRRFFNPLKGWRDTLPLHWLLAVLVAIHGLVMVRTGLPEVYALHISPTFSWLDPASVEKLLGSSAFAAILRLVLGVGLVIMAVALVFRTRSAWFMALFLLGCSGVYIAVDQGSSGGMSAYTVILVISLLFCWRQFDRSSLAGGSLFAVLGLTLLIVYGILGSLYFGNGFSPPITEASTAFYFSVVAMSTVGFGDIIPYTVPSRLFTTSIIILGITVVASSISAIVGPIIRGRLQRLVKGQLKKPMRKDHIIIAGVTPLAQSVYRALVADKQHVTVIVPAGGDSQDYPADTDIIQGDATDAAILRQAGASQARYILALRNDDSENAFIVLASREVASERTRTVALVNSAIHLNKIKQVSPDVVFSLQSLGAEILSRMVTGQDIDNELIKELLFTPVPKAATR